MGIFSEGQATRVHKMKSRGWAKARTKQPKRTKTIRQFRNPGPAEGLKLSFNPNDSIFPNRWVLTHNDIVLQVTRVEPKELWEELTKDHKANSTQAFIPIPTDQQDRRRRLDVAELRRINFWDRVQQQGVKKHSHPNLGEGFLTLYQKGKAVATVKRT